MRTRILALLPAIVLTACAVGPEYHAPTAPLPQAWSYPELRGASPLPAPWWRAFGDPALDALEERAAEASPDLETAALRFAQSRAQRRITAAQRGPQAGSNAGARRQRQSEQGANVRMMNVLAPPATRDELVRALSEPFDLFQAGFDASWELDLWGRVRRSIEAADADVTAARAALDGVRLGVQAETARNYFELRDARQQLALARLDLAAAEEREALLRARADGGAASALDAARETALLAELRARLPLLVAGETQASNRLALLLGEPPGSPLAEGGARPVEMPDLAAGLPSELARRRPDIRAAEARLHAATASVGIAVADLYPRIRLGGDFGYEATRSGDLGDWGSRRWSVGASLDLPVFDRGRRRGVITFRKLQQQEAAVAYQHTVLGAWHEIDTALAACLAQRDRHRALAEREAAARDAYELAHARYEGGLESRLADLDSQRVLFAAQREYAASGNTLANRLVVLYKALGGNETGEVGK
jgi:NodT family efflux transporter outer membrane factor (OMF) lipoprotein